MKRARLGPRTWLAITLVGIVLAIALRFALFTTTEREACLDGNGSWHADSETCRFSDNPAGW
ncbi:hypothetical protein [Maricaulis parjimensis]|uniref:hypothetical protein n=1 Tax=Maricaulis parjimensis TaxID=144023 RepID=UPI00193A1352|nr:hypothetical protein [Maricaulis parjimensis]